MEQSSLNLPEKDLKEIKEKVRSHIRSLNQARIIGKDINNLNKEEILQVLGFKLKKDGEVEMWLCGCDTACGTDNS